MNIKLMLKIILFALMILDPLVNNITLAANDTRNTKGFNLLFLGFPAHGHTNPTLNLIGELVKNGHQVTYLSTLEFAELINKTGATFLPYNSKNLHKLLTEKIAAREVDNLLLASAIEILPQLNSLQKQYTKFDAVLYDNVSSIWGELFAYTHHLPSFCSTTTFFFSTDDIIQKMSDFLPIINSSYQSNLNYLQKHYFSKLYSYKDMLDIRNCVYSDYAINYNSPALQPNSTIYQGEKFLYLGNRFNESKYSHNSYNYTRKPLIYISLGTVVNDKIDLLELFANSLSATEYEVIISTGNNENIYQSLKNKNFGSNINIYKFVNQLEVLSKTSLFITHAGMNSIYEGLYMGVPMIMLPQTQEQYINALRVKELKAGFILEDKKLDQQAFNIALKNVKLNMKTYKANAEKMRQSFLAAADSKKIAEEIIELIVKYKKGNKT